MSKRIIHISSILFIALVISSCSTTKYVPEGDYLYTGAKVKVDTKGLKKSEKKSLESDLTSILRPKPNSSVLGIRFKLMLYSKAKKGLSHWLSKKFGEPPVLFSSVKVDYNRQLITNRLENRGYFNSSATADTSIHGKKARLTYHAETGRQYLIDSVAFITDSSVLGKTVMSTVDESLLKAGDGYNLDVIKAERERIDSRLKEQGFYYFNPDYLIMLVDSTVNNHKVNIYVNVKDSTPDKAKEQYTINNIYIYPDYNLRQNSRAQAKPYDDFYVIDPRNTFKPRVFSRMMFFRKGDLYNRTDHNMSLNRLVNLGTFKFVKNKFTEVDSTGKPLLDTYYYLTPYPKKSLRLELLGKTNSANYTGSEVDLSWRNRNTFKGAELLTVTGYVGTDVQISGVNKANNIFRAGGEANLSFPRFITPFKINSTSAFVPRTKVTLGYDLLHRQNSYNLNSFRTSFGYNWKEDIKKEHTLNIFSVTYVQPSHVSDEYRQQAATDPTLEKAIEKQFIFGPTYNFNYTNTNEQYKRNTFYFNGNLDLSGNIVGLLSGADAKHGNVKTLFGTDYAQYIRMEADFRHYLKIGEKSQLASRIIAGYGYAYGNSTALPFVKQFFIGGSNSIRAFRARSLGPGTYRDPKIDTDLFTTDQSGDIKLEMNTEYRPNLFSIVRGAVFVDAGNIWLLNDDPDPAKVKPGAKFTKDFLNQLAVGTGVGLRFDLSFLILRTDLAFPIRKPWLPEGQRWVFDQIDFGSKNWRKENLVFNLAIGYPF
ncbi:BamA/TamA family outer membrane protein [Pedobacter sp. BS3]|uniref:translocation and assembly module lipoprotein TamL n=1 Tax=Pedobacter sp. BS3 TaxID=2567937 RepID=UPI0011EBECC0|nr:BamA/TamA family outer membrane protein [Pedobacter sp. BS3]TZF83260.1 BamA/TamA family outer membrane protein [Pedobacter sp. BS3]